MEQDSEEIEDVEEIRSVEVIEEDHKLIFVCNFSALGNQLTNMAWTQEDLQMGLDGINSEVAEITKSMMALENRVERRYKRVFWRQSWKN